MVILELASEWCIHYLMGVGDTLMKNWQTAFVEIEDATESSRVPVAPISSARGKCV